MKSKIENPADGKSSVTPQENGGNNFKEAKYLPNQVKTNHRTGTQMAHRNQAANLKEFLNNKLPQKKASESLISSIKDKLKSFHD